MTNDIEHFEYQGKIYAGKYKGPDAAVLKDIGEVKLSEVKQLYTANDKYNVKIEVGDVIFVARKPASGFEVGKAKVLKITEPVSVGYGWYQRKLKCEDMDSGEKFYVNNPRGVIVSRSASDCVE